MTVVFFYYSIFLLKITFAFRSCMLVRSWRQSGVCVCVCVSGYKVWLSACDCSRLTICCRDEAKCEITGKSKGANEYKKLCHNKSLKHEQRPINDKTKEPARIPLQNILHDFCHTAKPICAGVATIPEFTMGNEIKEDKIQLDVCSNLWRVSGHEYFSHVLVTEEASFTNNGPTYPICPVLLSLKEGGGNTEEITAWRKETRMLKFSSNPKCTLLLVWQLYWDVWPQRAQSIEQLCWAELFHWTARMLFIPFYICKCGFVFF